VLVRLIRSFRRKFMFSPIHGSLEEMLTVRVQCGQDSRIQHHRYSRLDMSAFSASRRSGYCHGLEFWAHARTYLAHYCWTSGRHCRICHCSKYTEHCGPIRGLLHLPDRRILSQLRHHWMGVIHTQSNKGEESCKSFSPVNNIRR
jgi:hypothetical protein